MGEALLIPQVLPPPQGAEVMGKMLCLQLLPVATVPYGEGKCPLGFKKWGLDSWGKCEQTCSCCPRQGLAAG